MISRRLFLTLLATPCLRAASFSKPIGINLYTVRDSLTKDPAATYHALASMGIREIEVRPNHLQDHGDLIRQASLQPVHMFIDSATVTGDWEASLTMQRAMAKRMNLPEPKANAPQPSLAEMAALAKKFGIRRLGISYLLPSERPDGIAAMNRAVEELAGKGVGFYYHNHAWEFEGVPGRRFLDLLQQEAHPDLRLELDLFWATIGGGDVVDLLGRWKGRVSSLHLKDVARDAPRQKTEGNMPATAFKEVGAGILDWPRVLRAAAQAGVEHYLIEQDQTPGDSLVSVRQSVDFLKQLNLE